MGHMLLKNYIGLMESKCLAPRGSRLHKKVWHGIEDKNEYYGRRGITLEFQWKVSFLNGNLDEVHDGPLIAPLSCEYRLVI